MKAKALEELFSFDITPYARQQTYPGGTEIFSEWQSTSQLIYLLEGRTKCAISHENGAVTILDFAQGPCFLGEMELLGVKEVTSAVTALTDCRCWVIQLEGCREQLLADPVFLRELCVLSNEKAIRISAAAARNQIYPLKNRLATFVKNTQRQGFYREPHTEAAAYLGVSYRHLLYVLAGFVKEGLLEKTSRGYQILDPAGLADLSIPDPLGLEPGP